MQKVIRGGELYCPSCKIENVFLTRMSLDSRALLTARYRSLFHSYISSSTSAPPPPELLTLLSSPRARLVDLSYLDASTGRSLLHEAARRKDLRLIELSIRAGADVFVRDAKGRGVAQGSGVKDERVKVFLRQCEWDSFLFDGVVQS